MCVYYISMYIFCIYIAHRQNMNIVIYACVYIIFIYMYTFCTYMQKNLKGNRHVIKNISRGGVLSNCFLLSCL